MTKREKLMHDDHCKGYYVILNIYYLFLYIKGDNSVNKCLDIFVLEAGSDREIWNS